MRDAELLLQREPMPSVPAAPGAATEARKAPAVATLLPHLPHEQGARDAEPPATEVYTGSSSESLPAPPCFMEQVTTVAEARLPPSACTALLLQRANMLMQDTVEAACMCMRAHIDPPLLAKHVMGAEHCHAFMALEASAAADGDSLSKQKAGPSSSDGWSKVVTEHVGQVVRARCPQSPEPQPWGARSAQGARRLEGDRARSALPPPHAAGVRPGAQLHLEDAVREPDGRHIEAGAHTLAVCCALPLHTTCSAPAHLAP